MMDAKIKICGLSDEPTLTAALDGGVDYVGFVFYGPSPRNIDVEPAATLAAIARGRAKIVALFVDPDDELLRAVVGAVKPDILQLHGSETPQRTAQIARVFSTPVMKAIKVRTAADAAAAQDYAAAGALILFDAKAEVKAEPGSAGSGTPADTPADTLANTMADTGAIGSLPGGNGVAFDWSALNDVKSQVAFMLSGGLNPGNVAQAIAATGAGAVDVSSGVERAPGVKDIELIKNFILEAKAASTASIPSGARRFD